MDGVRHPDARGRLEQDYLAGAISAEEYTRLRRELHDSESAQESVQEQGSLPGDVVGDPLAGVRLASWGRRASASLLDWLLLIAVMVAVGVWGFATTDPTTDEPGDAQAVVLFLAVLILPSTYQWLMLGTWGQTLGKMALGVRVVRGEDVGRVGYARAAGRVA
jgi:RDD family protein